MDASDLHRSLQRSLDQLSVIKHAEVFDSIPSTHLFARANQVDLEHGTALIALEQTSGVGQGKNRWSSPLGGLYLTLTLKPAGGFTKIFPFIAMMSLSIIKCFRKKNVDCTLKWPNDVYYKNKKIGGVLASGVSTGKHTKALILSAGVNLNTIPSFDGIPVETATAYREIAGEEADLVKFTTCLLVNFDQFYVKGNNEGLYSEYNTLLAFKDRNVEINSGSRTVYGKVLQVSKKGLLAKINGKKEILDLI